MYEKYRWHHLCSCLFMYVSHVFAQYSTSSTPLVHLSSWCRHWTWSLTAASLWLQRSHNYEHMRILVHVIGKSNHSVSYYLHLHLKWIDTYVCINVYIYIYKCVVQDAHVLFAVLVVDILTLSQSMLGVSSLQYLVPFYAYIFLNVCPQSILDCRYSGTGCVCNFALGLCWAGLCPWDEASFEPQKISSSLWGASPAFIYRPQSWGYPNFAPNWFSCCVESDPSNKVCP